MRNLTDRTANRCEPVPHKFSRSAAMLLPGAGNLVIVVPHVAVSLRPAHSVALLAAKIASKARVVALT